MGPKRPSAAPHHLLLRVFAACVVAVAVLDLAGLIPGTGDGPIGLAQILAAHLTIAVLIFVPFTLRGGAGALRIGFIVLAVASVMRFGGDWWSPPSQAPGGPTIEVTTLNLEVRSQPAPDVVAFLQPMTADVIALQELTLEFADAIAADPLLSEHYAYQALYPRDDFLGLGLLSRHPLSDVAFEGGPSRLGAVVSLPRGPIRVLNVHPLPAGIPRGPLNVPIGFDPTTRDAALGRIRDDIDEDLTQHEPFLLFGDINTAPTEPEFGRFTAGLHDAHAEVGLGPGWSYRPDRFEPLGIGMIRIDVVLTGPGLRPVAETTRCPPAGDHCAVLVTLGSD